MGRDAGRCVLPTAHCLDGVSGCRNGGADDRAGRADCVGVGTVAVCGAGVGVAAADAAVYFAHAGGGHGRAGVVWRAWRVVARLGGHGGVAVVWQRVF